MLLYIRVLLLLCMCPHTATYLQFMSNGRGDVLDDIEDANFGTGSRNSGGMRGCIFEHIVYDTHTHTQNLVFIICHTHKKKSGGLRGGI